MSLKIIRKYWIKAKKWLWQNFLVNENILEMIAKSIFINWKNIVEIWPWYWALTEKIIEKKPKSLNLVELDKEMIEILNKRKLNWDFDLEWIDFKINNIDVLKYFPNISDYSVIANIPYYITSPILRHFLYDIDNKPNEMLILMQKDVWDKILWKWKNKSSVINLIVEKKSIVTELMFVWKENFLPMPKVESSVLCFKLYNNFNYIDDEKFLEFIKKWFREPRKILVKNLEKSWYNKEKIIKIFDFLWIDTNTRWEDLNISIWCELFLNFNK